MTQEDMKVIAHAIALAVEKPEEGGEEAAALVKTLTDKYPLYE